MSFFYTTPPSAASSGASVEKLTDTSRRQLLREMIALPSGLVKSRSGNRSKRSLRSNKSSITSQAFMTMGPRPIRRVHNSIQVYSANLRIDSAAFFATSTTVPSFFGLPFTINVMAGSAPYLALFDQYRIDEIEVWIEPAFSIGSQVTNVGLLATAIDLDDANTPSTFTEVENHQSALVASGQAAHYHRWIPHMATAVYSGAFTSFANEPAGWIDSASPSVQHYGLKVASGVTTSILSFNLSVRARCSFRQAGL